MTAAPDNTHSIKKAGKRTTTKEKRQYTKSDSLRAYVFGAPNGRLNSATKLNSLSIKKKGIIWNLAKLLLRHFLYLRAESPCESLSRIIIMNVQDYKWWVEIGERALIFATTWITMWKEQDHELNHSLFHESSCTGWSKSLCAPDDYNTESYK